MAHHMDERRSSERYGDHFDAVVYEIGDDGTVERPVLAVVHDMSKDGIGALVEHLIEIGRVVLVRIDFTPEPKWFVAEIRHLYEEQEVGYHIGLKSLETPLTGPIAEELARLRRTTVST